MKKTLSSFPRCKDNDFGSVVQSELFLVLFHAFRVSHAHLHANLVEHAVDTAHVAHVGFPSVWTVSLLYLHLYVFLVLNHFPLCFTVIKILSPLLWEGTR